MRCTCGEIELPAFINTTTIGYISHRYPEPCYTLTICPSGYTSATTEDADITPQNITEYVDCKRTNDYSVSYRVGNYRLGEVYGLNKENMTAMLEDIRELQKIKLAVSKLDDEIAEGKRRVDFNLIEDVLDALDDYRKFVVSKFHNKKGTK